MFNYSAMNNGSSAPFGSNFAETRVEISRPALNLEALELAFLYSPPEPRPCRVVCSEKCSRFCRRLKTRKTWWKWLTTWIPFVGWISKYKWKQWILPDLIGGTTVGIMNIPQGMAYGILAGLRPEYGLYTSLFPTLLYCFLGTSRHMSVGTFAIISLLVQNTLNSICPEGAPNSICCPENATTGAEVVGLGIGNTTCYTKAELSASLTFLTGIFMFVFGVLRLGFIASYLSDEVVQGLTTGSAAYVFMSQLPKLFGVKVPESGSFLGIFYELVNFFKAIDKSNWQTVVISVICVVLLYINREYINAKFKEVFKFPLPMELVVVIIGTGLSYGLSLKEKYGVEIVGHIPPGFPPPALPRLAILSSHGSEFAVNAFVLAVVTFSLGMSLTIMFANKHGYATDANQEWRAFGLANFFSAFFLCHACGGSLSRSSVQEGQGCKTQLSSLISVVFIAIVIVKVGVLFTDLPQSVLAAIIVVSLKGLFMQCTVLPSLYRQSKIDFFLWVASLLAVLLLNVQYGLLASIAIALVTVIFRQQWPSSQLLANLKATELYGSGDRFGKTAHLPGISIFRFDAPLYYANVDNFSSRLKKLTGVNPLTMQEKLARIKRRHEKMSPKKKGSAQASPATRLPLAEDPSMPAISTESPIDTLTHIIIDCSSMAYLDVMGVKMLKEVSTAYDAIGITVFLACCKEELIEMFVRCEFHKTVPKTKVFPSVHDALVEALGSNSALLLSNRE